MTTSTFITDANIDILDLLLWAQGTKLFGAVPKVSKSLQLHISRIRFDMENPRTVFLDVAQFATSLSREMLETLEVAIQADGTVLLLEGHRRFIAMLYHYRFVAKLNPTDLSACLPCEVKKSAPDGASLLSKRLRKNDERESFHPIDEARALSRLMQERQLELPVLATELGGKYTVRFIQSRLSLLLLATKAEDGIPALEYFLTGSINETEAMLVARLPKNRQLEALNKIQEAPHILPALTARTAENQLLILQQDGRRDGQTEFTMPQCLPNRRERRCLTEDLDQRIRIQHHDHWA